MLGVPIGTFTSASELPNPPEPLSFSSTGIAVRPRFSLGGDVRIPWGFRVGADVRYAPFHLAYTATEQTTIATPEGGTRPATLQHDLGVNVSALALEPVLGFSLPNEFLAKVSFPLWFPITTSFLQTQRFTDPPNLTFVDGSLEQVTGQGALPNASSVVVGFNVQVEWHWQWSANSQWFPGIYAGVGGQMGSWQSSVPLRTVNPGAGIDVRWRPWVQAPTVIRDTTFIRDTVVILSPRVSADSIDLLSSVAEEFPSPDTMRVVVTEHYRRYAPKPPSILSASMRLAFEDAEGSVNNEARLVVRTVRRTRMVPMLPLVVFDTESTNIPSRYVQLTEAQAAGWKPSMALTGAGHWQYQVLNIVGARLKAQQGTGVQLIAYDDGTTADFNTAMMRASAVKAYIVKTFKVSAERISVDVRRGQTSQQPWVFVADSTRSLLKPITAVDTVTETRLPRVRITPEVVTEAGLRAWMVNMINNSDTVHTIAGSGAVPATLVWDMKESLAPNEVFDAPVQVHLQVTDVEGTMAQSKPGSVSVLGAAVTEQPATPVEMTYVLRWIGPDYLHTPDLELFGLNPRFDHIYVYPSATRREDFFVCDAPATVMPVGAPAWFRDGLQDPERVLFDHAEVYVK
jgi:hypothetical protein